MTDYVDITGTLYWVKHIKPDTKYGNRWTVEIVPDEEGMAKFIKAGTSKELKDRGNGPAVSFARPEVKLMAGKLVRFTPPIVFGKDGNTLISYVDDEDKIVRSFEDANKKIKRKGEAFDIGNGSKGKITIAVYDTMKGKGTRLESITVTDLVEFKREEQPQSVPEKPVNELDDEIPF